MKICSDVLKSSAHLFLALALVHNNKLKITRFRQSIHPRNIDLHKLFLNETNVLSCTHDNANAKFHDEDMYIEFKIKQRFTIHLSNSSFLLVQSAISPMLNTLASVPFLSLTKEFRTIKKC